MTETFCSEFVANLLSDLIVFGLGLAAALWIGKVLNVFERTQQRKHERLVQIGKTLRYLDLLGDEIRKLRTDLNEFHNDFTQLPLHKGIPIDTRFWDVLEHGGELPTLLSPDLLSKLTKFYYHVEYTRRGLDMLMAYWDVTSSSLKEGVLRGMIRDGLEKVLEGGRDLPGCIDSEAQDLKNELKRLE